MKFHWKRKKQSPVSVFFQISRLNIPLGRAKRKLWFCQTMSEGTKFSALSENGLTRIITSVYNSRIPFLPKASYFVIKFVSIFSTCNLSVNLFLVGNTQKNVHTCCSEVFVDGCGTVPAGFSSSTQVIVSKAYLVPIISSILPDNLIFVPCYIVQTSK